MYEFNLDEIVKALPKKSVSKIALKLGVSHTLVSLVLNGKRENTLVIDEALNIIEAAKKENDKRNERIKSLIK